MKRVEEGEPGEASTYEGSSFGPSFSPGAVGMGSNYCVAMRDRERGNEVSGSGREGREEETEATKKKKDKKKRLTGFF